MTDLVIHDIHRVLGPVPHDASPTPTAAALVDDLDDLGVHSCSAVASWQLFGDPAGRNARHDGGIDPLSGSLAAGRITVVPVILPAAPGGGTPGPDAVLAAGIRLVRACPVRHRWSLDAHAAMTWWEALADAGCTVGLDLGEVGFDGVARLARAVPQLRILALAPGYRELRRCAELLEAHSCVVVETGSLNTAGGVEWLAGVAGAERLAFGTGGPLADDAGPTHLLRRLELPRDQVERIASGTARDLLGVPA